jgi:hypothetical protein
MAQPTTLPRTDETAALPGSYAGKLLRVDLGTGRTWAQPWTGEYPWVKAPADEHLYEYACHEGNHAMTGIMKGERILDEEAEAIRKQQQSVR